jgi:hypothetical protein
MNSCLNADRHIFGMPHVSETVNKNNNDMIEMWLDN